MAAKYDILCEGCEHNGVHNVAIHWCNDCGQGYCEECIKGHKVTKVLRQHDIIAISDYLETKDLTIITVCSKHGINVESFCCQHNEILCLQCVRLEHRKCENLLTIQDASKGVKQSIAMRHVEERIASVSINVEKIIKAQHQSKESIQKQNNDILHKVEWIRSQINEHLDKLEQNISDDLNSKCQTSLSEVHVVGSRLQKIQHNVSTIKTKLYKMKHCLSDEQVFIGLKATEKELLTEVKALKSEMQNCTKYKFDLCINANIYSSLKQLDSIGKIIVDTSLTQIPYIEPDIKEGQQYLTTLKIDEIVLELIQTLNFESICGHINLRDCVILLNKLIFLEEIEGLLIYNQDGTYHNKLNIQKATKCMTILDGNKVAILVDELDYRSIFVFDISELKCEKEVQLKTNALGLSYHDKKLYVLSKVKNGTEIVEFNKDFQLLNKIFLDVENGRRFATTGNKFCILLEGNTTVVCCDKTGKFLWTFKNEMLAVEESSGIVVVDEKGNVFVAGSVLMVISPDGKYYKVLLQQTNQIRGLYFDEQTSQVLVYDNYPSATLFSVKY